MLDFMKIRTFDLNITPDVGTEIAGYGPHDETWEIHDELWLNGLIMDNGDEKAALLGFDLIGMDYDLIHRIRLGCAAKLGTAEQNIVLSCTHTHGGPHTRSNWHIELLQPYCDELVERVINAFGEALKQEEIETDVYFYSARANVNISRRFMGPENICRTLFENRYLEPLSDGVTDPEIGMVFFRDIHTRQPVETIVNFAAHPLASHCRGLGGHAITADYPAMIRKMIQENTRSHCTFVTGAAGDQFPIDSEIGWQNLDTIAKPIVREVLRGMVDAFENPKKFRMKPVLKTMLSPMTVAPSPSFPENHIRPYLRDQSEYRMDLHFLVIGELCFVGVPGELLAELGLEIKWHSPFRKAFVLYNSTDYLSYICPVNALVAGGYEAVMQQMEYRAGLKLVYAAMEGMFKLHGEEIQMLTL